MFGFDQQNVLNFEKKTVDEVILVDEKDTETGVAEKLHAHQQGLLHRAISVFIYNSSGKFLLQQRAGSKYHSAGLWSNTCCSHPKPGETTEAAAHRRLREEMGISAELIHVGSFLYHAEFRNGLKEHEYDHLFCGICNDDPLINPNEVQHFKWIDAKNLQNEIHLHPETFTFWFKAILETKPELFEWPKAE